LPEVSADGKTWTVRIRPGIYFADDAAFRGKKRELTAQDYVYSLKRHFDPKSKSPNFYLIDKRIVGMDAVRKAALGGGKFDYDAEPPAGDAESQAIAQRMHGKRLPLIDRVEVYVVEEAQPRWLAFLNGEHDLITAIPSDFVNIAVPEGKLAPNLQKKNLQMHR